MKVLDDKRELMIVLLLDVVDIGSLSLGICILEVLIILNGGFLIIGLLLGFTLLTFQALFFFTEEIQGLRNAISLGSTS